jgi:hypothetical protein
MKRLTPLRTLLVSLAVFILIAGVLLSLFMFRPVTFSFVIESRVADAIGGDVSIEDIEWLDGFDVSLWGVSVAVPNMSGAAAEVIYVDHMTVRWSGGFFDPQIDDLVVHDAVVRLMERSSWELTLADLHPSVGGGTAADRGGSVFPRVTLESIRVESGALLGSRFVIKGQARFIGKMMPLLDGSGGLEFTMKEVEGGQTSLEGTYHPAGERLSAKATGISLGPESQQLIPYWTIRHSAEQLELEGEVGTLRFDHEAGQPITASMWLDAVSIKLDPAVLGLGDQFWELFLDGQVLRNADPIPPRLFVDSGSVEFRGDEFEISGMEGHIETSERWSGSLRVPYRVDLLLAELDSVAAKENVAEMRQELERVPFALHITASDVRFDEGRVAVVPAEASRILELFRVRQCDVDMDLYFDRMVKGQAIDVGGRMTLSEGRGAYERFPYPMHDLDAVIRLDDDDIEVSSLTARGSGASSVLITGRVEATQGRDLTVRIEAWDVPLDHVLIESMPPRAEATLRDVFSGENVDVPAGEGVTHQIVDLDLTVRQDDDENLTIGGVIPFERLQMTWSEFPLTLLLDEGRLRWDENLYLEGPRGGAIALRTSEGGGRGNLAGVIFVPLGDGPGGGWIEFDVAEERIDASLLDALLHVSDGSTESLSAGRLEGLLQATGRVEIDGDDVRYNVETTIRRGSLAATPELDELAGLRLAGPLGGGHLLDLEGSVNVSHDGMELAPLAIRAAGADIVLNGTPRDGGKLTIDATGLHLGRWLLPYFPESMRTEVADLWNAWGPWGRFDVAMQLGGETLGPEWMKLVGLAMNLDPGQRVGLRGGEVVLEDGGASFRSALFEIATDSLPVMPVEVRGRAVSDGSDAELSIDSDRLMLSLPLLKDVIMLSTGTEGEQVWKSLRPGGEVGLHATWDTSQGVDSWQIELEPRTLEATWRARRLAFRDQGGSAIVLVPGAARIDRLAGTVGAAAVDLSGTVGFEPTVVEVGGIYTGSLGDDVLTALAGPAWEDVLETIEFEDSGSSRIDPLSVSLQESDDDWSGVIEGQVRLNGAALTTGLKLKDVHAGIDAKITLEPEDASIDLQVNRASAAVRDASVSGISGTIKSEPTTEAPGRIRIGDLTGELGGGRLVVSGDVGGVDGQWSASVLLANAALDRLFPAAADSDKPPSTGEVDASLQLRGYAGSGDETTGVGVFRVTDGYLRTLPVLVAMQQVLHLSSPVVGAIAFVDVEFFLHGGTATLDHIVLASGPMGEGGFSLQGDGTLDLETMVVSARLKPRGAWPLVRDVIGAIQDQFYEISMEGPVGDPEVGVVALPGLSRGTRSTSGVR